MCLASDARHHGAREHGAFGTGSFHSTPRPGRETKGDASRRDPAKSRCTWTAGSLPPSRSHQLAFAKVCSRQNHTFTCSTSLPHGSIFLSHVREFVTLHSPALVAQFSLVPAWLLATGRVDARSARAVPATSLHHHSTFTLKKHREIRSSSERCQQHAREGNMMATETDVLVLESNYRGRYRTPSERVAMIYR